MHFFRHFRPSGALARLVEEGELEEGVVVEHPRLQEVILNTNINKGSKKTNLFQKKINFTEIRGGGRGKGYADLGDGLEDVGLGLETTDLANRRRNFLLFYKKKI